MGRFVGIEKDSSDSVKGDIDWKYRLNNRLEAEGHELTPIGYVEDGKPVMQVTQDNTIIYLNRIADEMDGVVVQYDQDPPDTWSFYFREKFEDDEAFDRMVETVGMWACKIVTLYPMEHVVENYVKLNTQNIDFIPEGW